MRNDFKPSAFDSHFEDRKSVAVHSFAGTDNLNAPCHLSRAGVLDNSGQIRAQGVLRTPGDSGNVAAVSALGALCAGTEAMERAVKNSVAVEKFTEELESPYFKGGNQLSIAAGMGAHSVSDLDALANLVRRYQAEARRILEQVQAAQSEGRDWSGLINQAIMAQHKDQLSREAIETATNIGSWVEKAEPGAKRILSGLVADTLALAKKEQPCKVRPLRIVMLDDEPLLLDATKMLLHHDYNDARILTFTNAEEALQELTREDPDLLTTDWNHLGRLHGDGLLQLLAARKVKYPIFVISAAIEAIRATDFLREYKDQGLNITFLPKPFTMEQLSPLLLKHLDPGDGLTLRKGAP